MSNNIWSVPIIINYFFEYSYCQCQITFRIVDLLSISNHIQNIHLTINICDSYGTEILYSPRKTQARKK